MRKLLKFIPLFFIFFALSCDSDGETFGLSVRVTDESGQPIQNVLVRIYAPAANGGVDVYKSTNENGVVEWEYTRGKIFVNIDCGKGQYKGCSYAELFADETVNVDITLKLFNDPTNGCI